MSSKVKVALVGIGGYGELYLNALLDHERARDVDLCGVIDIHPQRSQRLSELSRRGIPVHSNMRQLFQTAGVDLTIVATPIHLHAPQTCAALSQGSNVLCEKPMAGSLPDALT